MLFLRMEEGNMDTYINVNNMKYYWTILEMKSQTKINKTGANI